MKSNHLFSVMIQAKKVKKIASSDLILKKILIK